jgi:hypothetical protein
MGYFLGSILAFNLFYAQLEEELIKGAIADLVLLES